MIENDDNSLEDDIAEWFFEIDEAKKRDKSYYDDGKRVIDIYSCKDIHKHPFNILYSNTETLIPALYSNLPRPSVQRRFKDEDATGKAAATAANRMLEFLIDTNIDGYETFNDGMRNAVLDALLPGRGVTCVKYDAEVGEYEDEQGETKAHEDNELAAKEPATDGDTVVDDSEQSVSLTKQSELICIDSRQWDSVLFGYAQKWSKMPWIAFEEHIDKDEAIRLFGKEKANEMNYTSNNDTPEAQEHEGHSKGNKHQGVKKTATIYQIWDKDGGRKVRYVSRAYKEGYLKVDDDPLELTGFYPIPKPMMFLAKANSVEPTALYLTYESQASELNSLSKRIIKLEGDIEAKALYDSELSDDLNNLVSASEGMFVPANKSSSMAADKGMGNAVWWLPIEQMVKVLHELYQAREACKNTIYEVIGMGDIMRSMSNPNETASAQNLKSQWGSMRLKRNQAEVSRYARDLMRIMLEIASTNFSEETWKGMTGLPYALDSEVEQANMVMKMYQQFTASQPPAPPPQPGQPPQETQLPPQYQQAVDVAKKTLEQPKWSDVLELLKNDIDRAYRIDIETNSTVTPDASEDQKNMSEAMAAMGQVLTEITPLIQQGIMPYQVGQSLLLAIIRRYQFGSELEDYIKQMQPPPPPPQEPPPPPDYSMQIKQMDVQAKQQSEGLAMQFEQMKLQMTQQLEQMKLEHSRVIEQGRASTQIHIAELQVESNEKLEEYKIQADSATKLEIARMNIEGSVKTTSMTVNKRLEDEMATEELGEDGEPVAKVGITDLVGAINEGMASMAIAHSQTAELLAATHQQGLQELTTQLTRPKVIIRDDSGRALGVQ